MLSGGLGEVANDGGVGVEEVITGHAGLARDTSGDDNDLSALERLGKTGRSSFMAADLQLSIGGCERLAGTAYLALGVDVTNVGSDTWTSVNVHSMSIREAIGLPGARRMS